ncbi:MAG TPA: hypothetical protein VGT04_10820 [Acidobacteriaceae bacterium]|nr:hypothetical protein [Acidobacteriaceae bacterium]
MPDSKLFIRLGSHSEKDYLLKTAKLFSGVIVGANLLESTPGATVSLALSLLGGAKIGFAVDPLTYTFGMDLSYIMSETLDRSSPIKGVRTWSLKKSFKGLAEQYGGVVKRVVVDNGSSIAPPDLSTAEIQRLCTSVLEYQLGRMRGVWVADPQLRDVAAEFPDPSFVFSPYFYIPELPLSSSTSWEKATVEIAAAFGDLRSPVPKYSVACFARSILRDTARVRRLFNELSSNGCDGCWFWISDLPEDRIQAVELENLRLAIGIFQSRGKPLFNMHGGYLSAALSKHGLAGFSHGIGYGESKDVIPVVGVTVPTVNYHLPPLHTRVPMLELERALSSLGITTAQEFHDRICDCTICKGVLKEDLGNLREFGDFVLKVGNTRKSQTPDSAKRCRFHFLLARRKELDFVNGNTLSAIKNQMVQALQEYSSLPGYLNLSAKAGHLAVWDSGL